MIVMKFGGTSVGSAKRMHNVAQLVALQKVKKPIVVVSAMSQVTNQLVELSALSTNKKSVKQASAIVSKIRTMHYETAIALQLETAETAKLIDSIDSKLVQLDEILNNTAVLGELTPRATDLIISFGERLSVLLVAAALTKYGVPAIAVEATELIVTDDNFTNAQPILNLSKKRTHSALRPILDKGLTPVITGFIGSNTEGVLTTLGRGGSDYSASIIGYCVDASAVWIWTDVDGVMTADPRYIRGAHTIHNLSYDEAAELSYFGAKVLHPRTMVPASLGNIPIFIKNTLNPTAKGTEITNKAVKHPDGAKALTVLRSMSLITVQGNGMRGEYGIAAKVFTALADEKVNILFISQASSENNISVAIDKHDATRAIAALKLSLANELRTNKLATIDQQSSVALIAVVGEGMRHHIGVAGRVFTALGLSKINIIAIAQGSSERNISIIVDDEKAHNAIQSIHDELHLNNGNGG